MKNISEICAIVKKKHGVIYRFIKSRGLAYFKKDGEIFVSDEVADSVVKSITDTDGYTLRELAKLCGVKYTTMCAFLKSNGVNPNDSLPRKYSQDVLEICEAYYKNNMYNTNQIATMLGVGVTSVNNFIYKNEIEATLKLTTKWGCRKFYNDEIVEIIKSHFEAKTLQ